MKYKEILHHPHYEPKNHPRASRETRAAQFSPFAALTGFDGILDFTVKTHELKSRRIVQMTDPDGVSEWYNED